MSRPTKLDHGIDAWLAQHEGWKRDGTDAIARTYTFPDFGAALAFVVRVACLAEKREHYPEIVLGAGQVRLVWTTPESGITRLDIELAAASDAIRG